MVGDNSDREERYRRLGLCSDESVGTLVDRAAYSWPAREAIVFEGRRLTFEDLAAWVGSTASALHRYGVRPGDRLLWQLPNCLEGLVLHLAAWSAGMVSVPVVPLYREHEMRHILEETQPSVVAFSEGEWDNRSADQMSTLMDGIGVRPRLSIRVGKGGADWSGLDEPSSPFEPCDSSRAAGADQCCLILYTSGTTSKPKGVQHNSRSLIAEASSWRRQLGFGRSDVHLMGAPITHIAGLITAILLPITTGGKAVMLPKWDPDHAVAVADAEKATFCCGAAVFLQDMVDRYESCDAPAHRLALFMCGGSAVPPSLIERADAVGVKAFRCWGMSEAPTTTLASPDDPLEFRAYRDGRASEGVEIQAVDDDHRPLPAGEIGELRVRAPEQMIGYVDKNVQAAQTDGDGWFYTGDIGFIDNDGWVTMTGRAKDIVNRGGEKFSSQDIENALASHPAVATAAVVGVPDQRLGETVAAFIVVKDGEDWPGRAALHAHLDSQRLAKAKFPAYFRHLDDIPRTMSGKVQKHELLRLWNESLATAPEPP